MITIIHESQLEEIGFTNSFLSADFISIFLRNINEVITTCVSVKIKRNDDFLILHFIDIKDFYINNDLVKNNEIFFEYFDISNIKDRGLEGIVWEISDHENDSIHFYCAEIKAKVISI